MTDQSQLSIQPDTAAPGSTGPKRVSGWGKLSDDITGWLFCLPLAVVLCIFLVLPIAMIVVVSFWGGYGVFDLPGVPV